MRFAIGGGNVQRAADDLALAGRDTAADRQLFVAFRQLIAYFRLYCILFKKALSCGSHEGESRARCEYWE